MINELTLENFESKNNRFKLKLEVIKEYYWFSISEIPEEEIELLSRNNYDTLEECLIDLFPNYIESKNYYYENIKQWEEHNNILYEKQYNDTFNSKKDKFFETNFDQFILEVFADNINLDFNLLFNFSHNNKLYFDYCSFKTYIDTFKNRFEIAQSQLLDLEYSDFLKKELINVIDNYSLTSYLSNINHRNFYTSTKKKSDYLKAELKKLNINYVIKDHNSKPPKVEFIGLDSFDFTNIPFVETIENIEDKAKVIILCETGILEHLFQKYSSIDKNKSTVSKICGALTNMGLTTIQPYINPLITTNGQIDKSNTTGHNPYKSMKAVAKANEIFNEWKIGIRIKPS